MKKTFLFILLTILILPNISYAKNIHIVNSKSNDLESWLIEEHSLPIISIKLAFKKSGGSYDPEGKDGLSYLMTTLMNEGAGELKGFEFQKELEKYAIHMSTDMDKDFFYISLKTLTKNKDKALELLSLAVTKPRFDQEAIDRMKKQILYLYKKRMEDPKYLASLRWNQTIYKNHPYKKRLHGTPESISNINKDDITKWFKNHINKKHLNISVVGDITKEELKEYLDKYFNEINENPLKEIPYIESFNNFPKNIKIHIDEDNPQTVIMFGLDGYKYKDKEFYPAYIMNYILGGGSFESRLMNEIREKRGLAYSVYSYLDTYEFDGSLKGMIGTKNESVAEVKKILRQEFKKLLEKGVTQEEVDNAKKYITGSFALGMDTNSKLANYLVFMQSEDLGINFLDIRNDKVNEVTLTDVNNVIKKIINPDDLIIITVGKEQ